MFGVLVAVVFLPGAITYLKMVDSGRVERSEWFTEFTYVMATGPVASPTVTDRFIDRPAANPGAYDRNHQYIKFSIKVSNFW